MVEEKIRAAASWHSRQMEEDTQAGGAARWWRSLRGVARLGGGATSGRWKDFSNYVGGFRKRKKGKTERGRIEGGRFSKPLVAAGEGDGCGGGRERKD